MNVRTGIVSITTAAAVLFSWGCAGLESSSRTARPDVQTPQPTRHGDVVARTSSPRVDADGQLESAIEPGTGRAGTARLAGNHGVAFENRSPASMGAMNLFGQLTATGPGLGETGPAPANDLRRITFTVEGADFDPAIDPTGRVLAYASTRRRKTADIYLKAVNGTVITQLTDDPGNEVMPTFSPDGKRIAFASDRAGNWDIYTMPVEGGKPTQITNDLTQDIHPSFSPDGKRLVYCSQASGRGGAGRWQMVVVDLANPTVKRVIGNGLFPTWSPTDDTILFQRARQRGTRWFSIWTVGLTDQDVTPPTEIAVSANAAVITPSWSPDGKSIVFCTVIDPRADEHNMPSSADIWTVAADGTHRVRLTQGGCANLQPVWAAGGAGGAIYFVSNRGPHHAQNIWAVNVPGSPSIARSP